MSVLKFWDSVREFGASDAAYLILGIEPEKKPTESSSAYRYVLRDMHKSYLDTCAHFRYCLEAQLDPNETPESIWRYDEDGEMVWLPSSEMSSLWNQCTLAKSFEDFYDYRYLALHWLESAIDQFHTQKFDREQLSTWIYWSELNSAYSFDAIEETTPEQRREHVRQLVEELGTQAAAARHLGISRTRVGQLIADPKDQQRKPLPSKAQAPFDWGRTQGGK